MYGDSNYFADLIFNKIIGPCSERLCTKFNDI